MKKTVFQSTLRNDAIQTLKDSTIGRVMIKKIQLKKTLVIIISTSFVLFNTATAYAQTTTPTTGDDSTTDTTDTTTDTAVDDTTVVDVIESTDSEQPADQPQEDTGGGGGGGGGAIIGLVVVGAIVAVVLTRKKSPKIQKTLVSDQVSGDGTQFIELSSLSSLADQPSKSTLPELSFQYGSYQQLAGFSQPYSFFNVRASKALGTNLSLHADAGTRLSFRNSSYSNGLYNNGDDVVNSQWLVLGLQTKNLLRQNDRLEFFAKYSTADGDQQSNNLLSNGVDLQDHESLFSDTNARFELAYSRAFGQNQRLRFLLQKTDSTLLGDDGYRAKIAWRHAF